MIQLLVSFFICSTLEYTKGSLANLHLLTSFTKFFFTSVIALVFLQGNINQGTHEHYPFPKIPTQCDLPSLNLKKPIIDLHECTGLAKRALVECGVYTRPVVFSSTGNDVSSLKDAIVRTFPGIENKYIALLKIRSDEYQGKYIDIVDLNMTIDDRSSIKIVLFNKVLYEQVLITQDDCITKDNLFSLV